MFLVTVVSYALIFSSIYQLQEQLLMTPQMTLHVVDYLLFDTNVQYVGDSLTSHSMRKFRHNAVSNTI